MAARTFFPSPRLGRFDIRSEQTSPLTLSPLTLPILWRPKKRIIGGNGKQSNYISKTYQDGMCKCAHSDTCTSPFAAKQGKENSAPNCSRLVSAPGESLSESPPFSRLFVHVVGICTTVCTRGKTTEPPKPVIRPLLSSGEGYNRRHVW